MVTGLRFNYRRLRDIEKPRFQRPFELTVRLAMAWKWQAIGDTSGMPGRVPSWIAKASSWYLPVL